MTGKDIFKIWAPAGSRWIDWIRPVLFIEISNYTNTNLSTNFTIPNINYISKLHDNTAIFLDLPGYESVKEGVALAKFGFRPIPLYNGTIEQQGAMALVENHNIESALVWGAEEIKKLKITKTAPPTFLLDSNRTHRFKMSVSVFDNSWDLYDQDIPSAEYFLKNGINTIIVRGEKIEKDLTKIFYKFQKKGITIYFTNGYETPKKVSIKKPRKEFLEKIISFLRI